MHALPLTYNKDMQEDKEHLFDAVDTLHLCLHAARGMLDGARFDRERLAAAASDELIAATDLADLLVTPRRAVPRVPRDRRRARPPGGRQRPGARRTSRAEELAAHSEHLDGEVAEVLSQRSWLESKVSRGRHRAAARARAARGGPRAAAAHAADAAGRRSTTAPSSRSRATWSAAR